MRLHVRSLPTAVSVICSALLAVAVIDAAQNPTQFERIEDHFKYGSVGIESEEGFPYWIWQALPRVFADKLPRPGGYASFGFVWEPGHDLPVGFSKADLMGGPRVAINCAFCHTTAYRLEPTGPRTLVSAGPGNLVDPQAYVRFLHAVADDPRFNANDLLAAIDGLTTLSWTQRMQYRLLLIPGTRSALKRQKAEFAWMDKNPNWGPGRVDPFNPIKFRILKQPLDGTIGNADMMPLWNMKGRGAVHWDGVATSFHESMLSSGIGNGASRKSISLESLGRLEQWFRDVPAPRYPLAVYAPLAVQGGQLFTQHCASCHAAGGARTNTVIPIAEVGTDAHRLNMWTPESATAFNAFADGYPWDFTGFRKTDGYVAVPLDGVWLRAPYLHNGSVANLHDLLEPPPNRQKVFYRGYDLFDPARVGFVSDGPAAQQSGTRYDTGQPGNGNSGHLYGTALTAPEKLALIEFLKTL